jgi:putative tryptophan/tyrosine transport system substrate-binding protein
MKGNFVNSVLMGLCGLAWAVAATPIASAADAPKVGILYPGPKGPAPSVDALVKALGDLGYKDGESVTLDIRYAEGKFDQIPALAKELVAKNPKIIVAVAGEALFAAAQATTTIPIVSATGGGDLVKAGLIKSVERPGGNVTGMWLTSNEAAAARVETLKKMMPSMIKLAVFVSATYPENQTLLPVAEGAAKRLRVAMQTYTIVKPEELEGAIAAAKAAGAEAIMTLQGPLFFFQRKLIADLALKHKLPLAMSETLAGDAGALLQVNPDVPGCAARSATHVDRILKGAKPGDLAVERYGGKQLVINLKTAKALGMKVDPSVLQGAKIIE